MYFPGLSVSRRSLRLSKIKFASLSFIVLTGLLGIGCSTMRAQTVLATDTVGASPFGMAVNPATGTTYVSNSASNTVSVINGTTNAVTSLTVGAGPGAVAVNPVTNTIYVVNSATNTISVINGSTNAVSTVTVGAYPYAVAVNAATNTIYVANTQSNNVSVINGSTNTVSATLTVGSQPYAVAVNPVTNLIYVANSGGATGTISVINGSTNAVASVSVGVSPRSIAVNAVNNTIYVANFTSGTVSVINGSTNAVSSPLTVGTAPRFLTVNPVTNTVYVANLGSNNVSVISGSTNTVSGTVAVGTSPYAVAVNVQSNTIFVPNSGSNSVSVINGATNAVSGTLTVGTAPRSVAVNPVNDAVYVGNYGASTVSVIGGATNAVSSVTVSSRPSAVALNPVTNTIYATNSGSGTVSVINGTTNAVTASVAVGSSPEAVAVNPVTNTIYAVNQSGTLSNSVSVINGTTNAVTATVTVGSSPNALAINSTTNMIYVANYSGGTVSVINGSTNAVTSTVTVGSRPDAVAVNPVTNTIYVANYSSGTVSVINGATNAVSSVTVGANPFGLAVNSVTNTIYVTNYGGGTVSAINGATNMVTATVTVGTTPEAVAVNAVTNTIYVANNGSGTVSVINGSTNAVTSVTVGSSPQALAVNALSNTVYVANFGASTVSVIDGPTNNVISLTAGNSPYAVAVNPVTNGVYVPNYNGGSLSVIVPSAVNTVPLTTALSAVSDTQTVGTTNVFETRNPTPSFKAQITSAYTGSAAYSGNSSTGNPTPTSVYYGLDGTNAWKRLAPSTAGNPATFTITLPVTQAGAHVLYVYAAYGSEGGGNSSYDGGPSLELGDVTALPFQIDAPQVALTGSPSSALVGNSVTLTATLAPATATGTIRFYDTFSGAAVLLNTATVGGGSASYTTSFSGTGNHTLIAVYSGDSSHGTSSGTFVQNIYTQGTTAQTITFPQPTTPAMDGSSVTLTATASSGLPVTYSVISGPATISGSTLSYVGTGAVVVEADQAGNGTYAVAAAVQRTVTVAENVGAVSGTVTATVTITAPGRLGQINVLTQGAANKDFKFVSGGTCSTGTTYSVTTPATTCTVLYTFTPSRPGQRLGAVSLTTGSSSSATVLGTTFLTGSGTGPLATFPGSVTQSTLGSGFNVPYGAAVDGNGNVFVVDLGKNSVYEIVATNGVVSSSSTVNTVNTHFNSANGLAVDGNGDVFVSDGAGTVYEIVAVNGSVSSSSTMNTVFSGFNYPASVAVDGSGNVFVADYSNQAVYEIVAVNGVVPSNPTVNAIGSGFTNPSGVAVDGSGDVFVADNGTSLIYEIVAVNGAVSVSSQVNQVGDNSFNGPNGVAIDASGNVFVADSNNGVVKEIVATNGLADSNSAVITLGTFKTPLGLALDGIGHLFVADSDAADNNANAAIYGLDLTAAPALAFATTAVGATSADSPQSVTVQNAGNAALTFTSLATGSTSFPVSGSESCSTGTALAVSGLCTVAASFTPQGVGGLVGSYTLTDNSLNVSSTAQTVALSGTGTPGTATFGTLSFSPASSVLQGTSQALTISDSLTYGGARPQGAVTFVLNGVGYTASCTTAGSPETCSATVPATTIAALSTARYTVTAAAAADANYNAATGASGTFVVYQPVSFTAPTTAVGASSTTQTAYVTIAKAGTTSATLGTAIQVLLQGTAGLDYAYVSGGTCAVSTTYQAGQRCTVQYTFTPQAPGLRAGAIVLSSGTVVLGTSYLQGTGTGPLGVITPGTISTIAGTGAAGFAGDGGAATSAKLYYPSGVAQDGMGNVYIADFGTGHIRKITASTSKISTVAGNGSFGYMGDGGPATSSTNRGPIGIAVDGAGNVYFGDPSNNVVRMINAAGIISTVAGNGAAGFSGDAGLATSASLSYPDAVAVDGAGNLYILDYANQRVRMVAAATGEITTVAGNGNAAFAGDGGAATSASINYALGIAVDSAGNLYIADGSNQRVRKVTASSGVISTVAGNGNATRSGDGGAATAAGLPGPEAVAVDGAGNLYISAGNIRKVTASTGVINTVAGNSTNGSGGDGGAATSAQLYNPNGLVVDGFGNLIISDYYNNKIRKVTATAAALTFASTAVGASSAQQVVTLANNGTTTALALSSLAAGSSNANFSGAGTTCSTSSTLAAGASCNLGVVFAPTRAGNPLAGQAVVSDNAFNQSSATQAVPVSGVATAVTPTFGTMSFSPAETEPQGTSQAITISDTVTYASMQPTGAVTFALNGVTYTASCTTAGSPETCTATVPAATIAALAVNNYTVTAALAADSAYNAATGTSGTFSITARTLGSFIVAGYPTSAIVTESGIVTVSALDSNGNADPYFTGTVTLTSSDVKATLPAAYTFQVSDNGVHSFSVTLNTVGTQSIGATSGSSTGSQTGILVGDAIWVLNATGTQVKLNGAGTSVTTGVGSGGTAGSYGGTAFDATGNVWSVDSGANALQFASSLGTKTASFTGGGLSTPTSVAVDGAGNVWIANSGNNTVSDFTNTGAALSGTTGYGSSYITGEALSAPSAVVVDGAGSVWVANKTGNSVTHIFGAAAPVATPLSTATTNGTLGTKP